MPGHSLFPIEHIQLRELEDRGHLLSLSSARHLQAPRQHYCDDKFPELITALNLAHQQRRPIVLMMGGHPIKLGLSRFLVDLIERGFISHLATNGAGLIHDFELALVGGTSEDVAKWIARGQFGLWKETGQLNDIIRESARRNEGLGEAIGRTIEEQQFPHRDLSIAAAGWRCGIPVTSHVTIGGDIIHAHPNCDGAALGQTSYTDFLIFARTIQDLEGGVYLNVGTAVTGPEVYLKALSMARNVAHQHGQEIRQFTTAVFDLIPLPENYKDGPPPKDHPLYYYRPWKTILCRTIADGGTGYYFPGDHRETIPTLWHHLTQDFVRNDSNSNPQPETDQP